MSKDWIARTEPNDIETKFKYQKIRHDDGTLTKKLSTGSSSLIDRLISKASLDEGSSSEQIEQIVIDEESQPIQKLYIMGITSNCTTINEEMKEQHKITQRGITCEVNEYLIFILGRQQIKLRDGMEVGLFIPPNYKSAKNPKTGKISVIFERKINNQDIDPLQYPYIVVSPNQYLYPTYLCTWIQCKRKITIQHYVEYGSQVNQNMVYGNAIHKYFQWLVKKEVESKPPSENQFQKLYHEFLYDMYLIKADFNAFVEKCSVGMNNLANWHKNYIEKGSRIQLNKWQQKYLKITGIVGSQVMLKSRYFGIKGKVDALFKGLYIDDKKKKNYTVYVPFQLKTGKKARDSYKRQIDLYVMLVRQEKKTDVIGLLYYSQLSTLQYRCESPLVCYENINNRRNQIIINQINLYNQEEEPSFPQLPQTFDSCKYCNCSYECGINRINCPIKDIEQFGSQEDEILIKNEIGSVLQSLTNSQLKYIKKWMHLLYLEEKQIRDFERANVRGGYGSFKLEPSQLETLLDEDISQHHRFKLYRKIKQQQLQNLQAIYKVGDKVKLCIPTIMLIEQSKIVSVTKSESKFLVTIELVSIDIKYNYNRLIEARNSPKSIRAEIEQFQNNFFGMLRGLVHDLVAKGSHWLKNLIINEVYQPPLPQSEKINSQQMQTLNEDQQQAFTKCISNDHFCLVEGMPGTGKTQLILKLIQYFYGEGKRVLVTSFTNQSLINIMVREITKEKKIPQEHLLRQGSKYGFISSLEHLTLHYHKFSSVEEYNAFFQKKKVWFVTLNSLYIHHIPQSFDVVIVDEASQCVEPICLKALMKTNKFILIGDAKQLRPLIKSPKAFKQGMSQSLFQRLANKFPNQKVTLKKQYRMNADIMNLSNQLVYEGMLQIAQPTAGKRMLLLNQKQLSQNLPDFLQPVLDPRKPLRFINYDQALDLFREESKISIKIRRFLQMKITILIYEWLRKLGLKREDILIISLFNSTVSELSSLMMKNKLIDTNKGDVLTIDKSQGSDKQVIIFLFQKGHKELVENPRRLNVALTRAKNKFIIIGSQKYIQELAVWTGRLAQLLKKDQIDISSQLVENLLEQQ